MFSLQRMLGRDDEFCALLEAGAQEAVNSVSALKAAFANTSIRPSLEAFAAARRKDKQIAAQISDLLVYALVTSLERQDIELISDALYRIPKTVEKFAERFLISFPHVRDFDFTRQIVLMEEATRAVLELVRAFRGHARVAEIKRHDARIQSIENQADEVILAMLEEIYRLDTDEVRPIILRDLLELNEKVVDRCRDASGAITRVAIKIS